MSSPLAGRADASYAARMAPRRRRPATVRDVHRLAAAMPDVTREGRGKVSYSVGGKSFLIFRNPRPDAVDPETGERYDDVIVFWVESEEAKQATLADDALPFFTTGHFDRHPSVLLRGCRVGELDVEELGEFVSDAWLARASPTRARRWLAEHHLPPPVIDGPEDPGAHLTG